MSWAVKIMSVTHVKSIDGADRVELAIINNGYPCVVAKGQFKEGSLVVYIPVDSLLPPVLLEQMGLTGRLSGSRKNRVKAVRLRKQLSIGLLLEAPSDLVEGDECAERFGITQWEEPIPVALTGVMRKRPKGYLKYDVSNINGEKEPFIEGEEVVVHSKMHGTNFAAAIIDGSFHVCSRNMSLEQSEGNFYWQVAVQENIEEKLRSLGQEDVWLHGEALPCQDLRYGLTKPTLYIFDIRDQNRFLNYDEQKIFIEKLNLKSAPLLYRGPYSRSMLAQYDGSFECISGKKLHVEEGVVIKPVIERRTVKGDYRVIFKYINPQYLLRSDGTEGH